MSRSFSLWAILRTLFGAEPLVAWDARVPLPVLRQDLADHEEADRGVGRGPGGPPHSSLSNASLKKRK